MSRTYRKPKFEQFKSESQYVDEHIKDLELRAARYPNMYNLKKVRKTQEEYKNELAAAEEHYQADCRVVRKQYWYCWNNPNSIMYSCYLRALPARPALAATCSNSADNPMPKNEPNQLGPSPCTHRETSPPTRRTSPPHLQSSRQSQQKTLCNFRPTTPVAFRWQHPVFLPAGNHSPQPITLRAAVPEFQASRSLPPTTRH